MKAAAALRLHCRVASRRAARSLTPPLLGMRSPCVRSRFYGNKSKSQRILSEDDISVFSTKPVSFWEGDHNVKTFLEFVARRKGINTPESWYDITSDDIKALGGSRLLASRGTLSRLIPALLPETALVPWKFDTVPKGFWSHSESQKAYMKWLAVELDLPPNNIHAWYTVTHSDLTRHYGRSLLNIYGNSLLRLLSAVYPGQEWLPWRFERTSNGFWGVKANQRRYLDWLATRLGYRSREDWYHVQLRDFLENDGGPLLSGYYSNSPHELLSAVYSDFTFHPWLFFHLPQNTWNDIGVQRNYIEWLMAKVGVMSPTELLVTHFRENSGSGLIERYRNSIPEIVKAFGNPNQAAPILGEREVKPLNYWASIVNQKAFLAELSSKLGFQVHDFERWYQVSTKDFLTHGGSSLLARYQSSVSAILQALLPEHPWVPWKFKYTPKVSGKDPAVLRGVVEFVEQELHFKSPEEWNRVSAARLKDLGVYQFFKNRGGVKATIKLCYPDMYRGQQGARTAVD